MALCLLLLLPVQARAALTPAGSVITHSFTVSFGGSSPSLRAMSSNPTRVTVKDLTDPSIVPARSAATPAGQPIDFLHTVGNRGNSADSFRLSANLLSGPLPANGVSCRLQFLASDGKTLLPVDGDGMPMIGPIAPGGSQDLVLRVTPPPESAGRVETITVKAASLSFPLRDASVSDQLVVPNGAGLAVPIKTVVPAGAVLPGALLSYGIALMNGGPSPIGPVRVTDPLNPLLDYRQGSALFPAGLTGSASYDPATRTLGWEIASVPAGFSGSLTFQARVRADAPANGSIPNAATQSSPDGSVPSNSTLTTVLGSALQVTKQAGSSVAEAGDVVSFSVRVENIGVAALTHLTLADRLPRGFRYLRGSSVLDGARFPDPVRAGGEASWDLGTLQVAAVKTLGYRCVVTGDVQAGTSVNWVTASGVTPTGGSSVSPPAGAAVKVRPSILGDKAIILGRVFEDRNGNGIPDPGEPGISEVRIYLEDGSFVFTDREGQYSITGVSAGNHVVKIDRTTLHPRYLAVPYNTAFAGVGWSQFVTVPFGGPARGDFALTRVSEPVVEPAAAVGAPPPPWSPPAAERPPVAGPQPLAGPASRESEETPVSHSSPISHPSYPSHGPPPVSPSTEGAVAHLQVTPNRVDQPADGKSVVPFTVELLTRAGKRVAGVRTVTVSLGKGALVDPDADPKLSGHQLLIQDGVGVFRVRSTRATGQDRIRVTGENGTRGEVDLYFSAELSDWIVVGLGNLTAGGRGVSGHLEKIGQDDRFEQGIYHEERLAFFTRGKILGKYLLTAAYDSQKERRDGVFQTIDPEKYYPVYGDASDTGYEAQSQGKLYLKLEAGRSYLLAGDYQTALSENEFSRYDRNLNGVKFEANGEKASVKGFESRTQETVTRDEVPGNGTSGYYFLSVKPVFENSERVRIEIRDRYHSERVLSVTEKLRYADYSIDYSAGTILFKEPVPSLDQNLNPVTIVVNYQSDGGGAQRYLYGGRALVGSADGSYLGGTGVVEQGAAKDSTLFGLDGRWKLGDRLTLKGEGARSDNALKGKGNAWKGELSAHPGDSLDLAAYYRRVEAGFSNSSMTGNEIGTEKYGGRLDYRGFPGTLLFAESFVQKGELDGTRQIGNQAGLVRKCSLFEWEGGFKSVAENKNGAEARSDLLYAGIKGSLLPRLDATLRRDQLLSPSRVSEYQSRTFLKLDYRLTDRTTAFLTEEYQEGVPLVRQATRVGLESRLSERMRLTTGYQLSSGAAGAGDRGNVDLNTKLVEREGFSLDSRSGYQLENALSGARGEAILGLNSRYRAAEGLYLDSSLERVQAVEGNAGTRTAFTLAGEYLRVTGLKLTGRYEIRSGPGESASLYAAGLAYKASSSLTLLGKASLFDREADAGRDLVFDGYLGASFRPLAGNPLQLLTLARYKVDDKGSVPGSGANRSLILSAEPSYRLVKDWSLQGKYAVKVSRLAALGLVSGSYTDLLLAGLSYDLAERFELSAYLKLMNQYDTGQHGLGAVAGVGYRIYRNVVLSAGYNWARLDDRDLTGESFQGGGPFFGVKVKFDEEMFDVTRRRVVMLPPAPTPPAAVEEPRAAPAPPPRPVPALLVSASRVDEPLRLSGSAELLTLLINGEPARLPSTAVAVNRLFLGSVDLRQGRLVKPLEFAIAVERRDQVRSWSLDIADGVGRQVRVFRGKGAPEPRLAWGGETDGVPLKVGEIYQYRLRVAYRDGSVFSTGVELFGVNRQEVVLLSLGGGSFIFDSARLTEEGRRLLRVAAAALRAHPREKVVVEGHTDGIGTARYNMALSRKRCEAAAAYLVGEESIPASRLVRRWYGKGRPVADNGSEEGRRLNRRVEIKGLFQDTLPVSPGDRYRGAPFVTINDRPVPVDALGRFETSLPADAGALKVEMGDSLGRSLATAIPLPELGLMQPSGEKLIRYGSTAWGIRVDETGGAHCTLSGGVAPGSTLEVGGKAVPLDADGRFDLELRLERGEQVFGLVLRNGGSSRLMNLTVQSAPQGAVRSEP